MKKLLLLLIWIVLIQCAKPKEKPEMAGAYNMLSQSVKGDSLDSTYTDRPQLKIYTGDFIMYAQVGSKDSVAAFGIGTFVPEAGGVKEDIFYSASGNSADDSTRAYTLEIEKTPAGFKQAIQDIEIQGKKYTLGEDYESVGEAKTSPLDGAWENIKFYNIKGKDTTTLKGIQYKAYGSGQVIFAHTYLDSLKKLHTGMGFGSYEMTGDNKVKEICKASNYGVIRGRTFDIEIELQGSEGFKQTITNSDGTKNVEIYKRLKK